VQKGRLFKSLTKVCVIPERSEAAQGGVDFDYYTFLHFIQFLILFFILKSISDFVIRASDYIALR